MKAFAKTLIGDARNVAAVAIIVAVASCLTGIGHPGLGSLRHAGYRPCDGGVAGRSLT